MAKAKVNIKTMVSDVELNLSYNEAVALRGLLGNKISGEGMVRSLFRSIWKALDDAGVPMYMKEPNWLSGSKTIEINSDDLEAPIYVK